MKKKTYLFCNFCKNIFYSGHKKSKYCCRYCYYKSKIGRVAVLSKYKGGKYINAQGYVLIRTLDHPNRDGHDYIRQHILVMEKKIGRYLKKGEVVHHINNNKSDNRITNLMLFKNNSEHMKFHKKLDKKTIKKLVNDCKKETKVSVAKKYNISRNTVYRYIKKM